MQQFAACIQQPLSPSNDLFLRQLCVIIEKNTAYEWEYLMKIFLSSTYEDLTQIRKAAINFLNGLTGYIHDNTGKVVAMESFDATENTCKKECLQQLSTCDLAIGIYGEKYGSIDAESGLSMTEVEFDYATKHKIPILAFVMRTSNRDELEEIFIKQKVYARNLSCANFESETDFLDRLNGSLQNYLGGYDGYSIDSLWSEVSALRARLEDDLKNDRNAADLQMMPYLPDQENEAIEDVPFLAQKLPDIIADLESENSAIYDFAYMVEHYPENITEDDRKEVLQNIQDVAPKILANWEAINIGLRNYSTSLNLLGMYLKLKKMQHRLATEPWSEKLRQEVVATRELYLQTVQSSHYID